MIDRKYIYENIKNNRPKLKNSSIKTYESILYNFLNNNNIIIDDLKNYNNIIKLINQFYKEPNKKKLLYSSIIVYLDNNNNNKIISEYKKNMIDEINKYNDILKTQKKSDKQANNWITIEEINDIYDNYKNLLPFIKKKLIKNFNMVIYQQYQDFIILSLYLLIPPRRLKDYTYMKIIYSDNKNYNYYNDNQFIFNNYKTSNKYGSQVINLPTNLINILNDFINIRNKFLYNEFLLIDTHKNKLSSITLNQRLNKIFNKKISVNMLRHIYISDKILKDMPKLDYLNDISQKMGHNVNTQILYKKI